MSATGCEGSCGPNQWCCPPETVQPNRPTPNCLLRHYCCVVCTSGGSFQSQIAGSADKKSTFWESVWGDSFYCIVAKPLNDLYGRTVSHPEETRRNKVAALLTEFAGMFAYSANDLPRTSIVKHEIHTHESKPICQNPRCLPISQQAMAEAEIENMLKRGVIKP